MSESKCSLKFEFNGENVDEKNSKNRYNHNYVR